MYENENKSKPNGGFLPCLIWVIVGAGIGALIGFYIRGELNEAEVIGFANIPEQLQKLSDWAFGGGIIGAAIGYWFGCRGK